jgi:hypothetical protein
MFIPRRDSNSSVNVALGGRFFPGVHHAATFRVAETKEELRVTFASRDHDAPIRSRQTTATGSAASVASS